MFTIKPATRLAAESSGQMAIIFALSLTAIVSVMGLATELGRGVTAESDIQNALDASVLAAAKSMQDETLSDAQITAMAVSYFKANIPGSSAALACPDPVITIDRENGTLSGNMTCSLPTTIGNLFNVNKMDVAQRSVASVSISRLDLAMMLDVSGSMSGQKLKDLQAAAKEAIDILITDKTGDRVRIAFNTYSTAINVGSFAEEVKGPAYDKTSPLKDCVTERKGAAKFKDNAPGPNKYMGFQTTSVGGKSLWCPDTSIEPLTSNAKTLKDGIDTLKADGWTAGHLGVAWAWYLIAPDWDKIWPTASKPLAYDDEDTTKAVILMTDGQFNTSYEPGQGNSDKQSEKLCKEMRDEGVIVYTVAFKAPKAGKKILQKCATSTDTYFDAKNGTELKDAYKEIASQLKALRIAE